MQKNGIDKKPEKTQIGELYRKMTEDKILHFFTLSSSWPIDSVVDIFLRMNSGGLPLKRTELLFALAINNWPGGRGEIEAFLHDIHGSTSVYGDWANVDKDFVLRSCLYLSDEEMSLSADKLTDVDFGRISSCWDEISASIADVLKLLDEHGHCSSTIKSHNAILPLVYYRYKNKAGFDNANVKTELNKLFITSQVNELFSSSTDSVLLSLREKLQDFLEKSFVFSDYAKAYGSGLKVDEEVIRSWIFGAADIEPLKKGEDTKLILASLPKYRDRKSYAYEQDHLHPAKTFENSTRRAALLSVGIEEEEITKWSELKDTLGNLQLYRDRYNQNKSGKPLADWKREKETWDFAYDPADEIKADSSFNAGDDPYDIKYYPLFVEKRGEMIAKELNKLLL